MKKTISTLLSFIMIATTILCAPFSVKAANNYTDCITNTVDVSTIEELTEACQKNDGAKTIRLTDNVNYNGNENAKITISNPNSLVLDLNGHSIIVRTSNTITLFNLIDNAKVYVINSDLEHSSKIQFTLVNQTVGCSIFTMNSPNASLTTFNVRYVLNGDDYSTAIKSNKGVAVFNVNNGDLNILGGDFTNEYDGNIIKYSESAQCYELNIAGNATFKSGNSCIDFYNSSVYDVNIYDAEFYILTNSSHTGDRPRIYYEDSNKVTYKSLIGENKVFDGLYSTVSIADQAGAASKIDNAGAVNSGRVNLKFTSGSNNQTDYFKMVAIWSGEIMIDCETGGFADIIAHQYKEVDNTAKNATCTENGNAADKKCAVCGHTVIGTEMASAGHKKTVKITKATVKSDGKAVTVCEICSKKLTSKTIAKISSVSLSASNYTYSGKVITPGVTVKDKNGKVLKKNTDYKVSYSSGRKNVGKYSVKISFIGNYSGSKTLYFTVKPKSTSISSLTAKSKSFGVKWKKQATQTTGYQVQYSTSSKFTNPKTVTISNNGTTSKSITKLSSKKKYYVRVRTYKTVKVNGKSTKIYSGWSSAKTVTTKA